MKKSLMRCQNTKLFNFFGHTVLVSCVIFLNSCATTSHMVTKELILGNEAAIHADYTTATSHYEAALKYHPNSTTAKRNLGIVYVKVGQYEKAKSLLKSVMPQYSDDIEVYYFLGEATRGLEDYEAALVLYKHAQNIDSNDLRITKAIAWTYFKLKKYEYSASIPEKLINKYPGDLQLKLIAASNYNKLNNYDKTITLLGSLEKTGFKVLSRDLTSAESERALLITALADAYLGTKAYDKASNLYQTVLRTRPFLASALIGSARCDLANNFENKATAKLERALRANPETPETYYLLGSILSKQDTNRSLFYLKRFLLLTQNNKEFIREISDSKTAITEIERKTNSIPK